MVGEVTKGIGVLVTVQDCAEEVLGADAARDSGLAAPTHLSDRGRRLLCFMATARKLTITMNETILN